MLNREKSKKCPICGGKLTKVLREIKDPDRFELYMGISRNDFCRKWIKCEHCGAATNMFSRKIKKLLSKIETSYYSTDLAGVSIEERFTSLLKLPESFSDNKQRVKRVISFMKKKEEKFSVLDIGSGTGVFLTHLLNMEKKINHAVSVEPDPVASKHLKSLQKFKVVPVSYPTSQKLGKFNLITLNKVLEHVSNPILFLSQIKKNLFPNNGFVYVEVPDILNAHYRLSNDNSLGSLHHNLYSVEALSFALVRAGLTPLLTERILEPSGKLTVYAFASTKPITKYINRENIARKRGNMKNKRGSKVKAG